MKYMFLGSLKKGSLQSLILRMRVEVLGVMGLRRKERMRMKVFQMLGKKHCLSVRMAFLQTRMEKTLTII